MANRKQRRQKCRGGNPHDMVRGLARARAVADTAQYIEAEKARMRMQWLTAIVLHDTFGFGAGRIVKYYEALIALSEEYMHMRNDIVGTPSAMQKQIARDYADAKLKARVEQIMGSEISSLYDDREEQT